MGTPDLDSTSSAGKHRTTVHEACQESRKKESSRPRFVSDESGQVLPWLVLLMFMFLGFCALSIDVGHAMLVKRQLQASTDAAALAAAQKLPSVSDATAAATTYGSSSGQKNAYAAVTVGTPAVSTWCSTTVASWGIGCTTSSPNAVAVTETATVPMFFAGFIGVNSLTVTATSSASRGAKPQPFNVAIVLDTTPSMNTKDTNCGGKTQLQCAMAAFQQLLQGLDPTLDRISLFTFPDISTSSVTSSNPVAGYTCGTGTAVGPYVFPSTTAASNSAMPYSVTSTTTTGQWPNQHTTTTTTTTYETYQVTGFLTDYRGSDTATSLSTSSVLTQATGGKTGCAGISTSNNDTYLAGAIYAAQASLVAAQQSNPGSMNAMIILSDGNATAQEQNPGGNFSVTVDDMLGSSGQSGSTGTFATNTGTHPWSYPSWEGECGQEVIAANYASGYVNSNGKSDGTIVFTVAYGSPSTSALNSGGWNPAPNSGNCGSDVTVGGVVSSAYPNISPCQAMQDMSTGWPGNTSHFFSDYYAPGGDSGCQAADANNTITSLNGIVNAIVGELSGTRLIPNGTP